MKIYFSRKFYSGKHLSALDPEIELTALKYLKATLLKKEDYETIGIIQNRINAIHEERSLQHHINLLKYGTLINAN